MIQSKTDGILQNWLQQTSGSMQLDRHLGTIRRFQLEVTAAAGHEGRLRCPSSHPCCHAGELTAAIPHPKCPRLMSPFPGTLTPELSTVGQGSDPCSSLYSEGLCSCSMWGKYFHKTLACQQGHACKIPYSPVEMPSDSRPAVPSLHL